MSAYDDIVNSIHEGQQNRWYFQRFQQDNPNLAPAVLGYLAGGPRPSEELLGENHYARQFVFAEDARRKLALAPAPPEGMRYGIKVSDPASADTARALGAKFCRMHELGPSASVDEVRNYLNLCQSRGIEPLLLVMDNLMNQGSMAGFPGNVPEWARRLGPGGDLAHPSLSLRWLEIGNEQFYTYSGKPGPGFAGEYARGIARLYPLVKQANPNVKLAVMLDMNRGRESEVVAGLYSAVPDFHRYVDGWVFHLYGPMTAGHVAKVAPSLDLVAARGAPSTIPILVTEDGISTNDGQDVGNNYGWPTTLTFAQAGAAWRGKVRDLVAHPEWGSRVITVQQYRARDNSASDLRERYFGACRLDGTAKGDFTQAARDLAAQYH